MKNIYLDTTFRTLKRIANSLLSIVILGGPCYAQQVNNSTDYSCSRLPDYVFKQLFKKTTSEIVSSDCGHLPNSTIWVFVTNSNKCDASSVCLDMAMAILDKNFNINYIDRWDKGISINGAFKIRDVKLDLAPYMINPNSRAVGVLVGFGNMVMGNGTESNYLSLYLPNSEAKTNHIARILDGLVVESESMENQEECGSNHRIVIMGNERDSKFREIIVKSKEDESCGDPSKIVKRKYTIPFDTEKGAYIVPDKLHF